MSDYEYSVEVPSMYTAPNDDAGIVIRISAHGGGTVGESYADRGWDYSVEWDGREILAGDDLRSAAGRGDGHAERCRALAGFLAAAGESLHHSGERSEYINEYTNRQMEFLTDEYERLGAFADQS